MSADGKWDLTRV